MTSLFKLSIFRYFSSLFAASKSFPDHIGLASGTVMALFGLSPLFLSVVATNFFIDPATGLLNTSHFTTFLALLTGLVYILGFINLPRLKHSINQVQINSEAVEENIPQETSPLLAPTPPNHLIMQPSNPSIMELLHGIDFWLLVVYCVLILGAVCILSTILVHFFEYFHLVRDGDIEYWYNRNGCPSIGNWMSHGTVNCWFPCCTSSQTLINFQHPLPHCGRTFSRFYFTSNHLWRGRFIKES